MSPGVTGDEIGERCVTEALIRRKRMGGAKPRVERQLSLKLGLSVGRRRYGGGVRKRGGEGEGQAVHAKLPRHGDRAAGSEVDSERSGLVKLTPPIDPRGYPR